MINVSGYYIKMVIISQQGYSYVIYEINVHIAEISGFRENNQVMGS